MSWLNSRHEFCSSKIYRGRYQAGASSHKRGEGERRWCVHFIQAFFILNNFPVVRVGVGAFV
jgi:hypothetical protein